MDLLFLLSTHLDSLLFVVVLINLQNIEIFENNNTLTDLCIKLPLTLFRLGGVESTRSAKNAFKTQKIEKNSKKTTTNTSNPLIEVAL